MSVLAARTVRTLPSIIAVGGVTATLLLVFDLVSLWPVPPPGHDLPYVISGIAVGAGFAVAGLLAAPGSTAGAMFLAGGVLLLAAPVAVATGELRVGLVLGTLGAAVAFPVGGLLVPPRNRLRRTLRAFDVATGGLGVAVAVAVALGRPAPAQLIGWLAGAVFFCAGWIHFELTAGDDRRQVLWLVLGVCSAVPTTAIYLISLDQLRLNQPLIGVLLAVFLLPLPVCAALAVRAPEATDVRAVISRAVVGAIMLALTVSVFGLGNALLTLANGRPPGIGYTGAVATVVAACFHPVLVRVRATVDEMLFGGRADAVVTLTRLGEELTAGSSPQEWLAALRSALAVPGIELRSGDELLAAAGSPVTAGVVTGLRVGSEHVGDLLVALPPEQQRLPATTRAVLRLVAGPLAQAVYATRLTRELRASRASVVAALEEERRRIRRDLHDGLGPTLTGIAYSADAAANLIPDAPAQAAKLVRELRADAADGINEIRRIVEDLRPRALDELGLVAAVRQSTARLHAADGQRLNVSVDCDPAGLPPLPAAVEVVAYRVAVEAVTNVARHAGVHAARVEFALSADGLRLTVADLGRPPGPIRPGVGLTTMRERVEALAGDLSIHTEDAGTTVRALLPLPGRARSRASGT